MDEVDTGALGEVAYGLFELTLNARLSGKNNYLFRMVEAHVDFKEEFFTIFEQFSGEYPQLAAALVERFGTIDAIYEKILGGEGVIPSKTTYMYWIVQDAPDIRPDAIEDELAGKWLIFLPPELIDDAWKLVRDATADRTLGISAKVSTAKENPDSRDSMKVIYVYTADWRDEADVMRVRSRLRELGFVDRLGYKRNIETFKGEYSQRGKKVTFYSA
ncbi:MAG: DUF1917 domain-containing protein [Methanoregulaceae archaeon]|nr:DUF1917 domain-containing protein [Methanoregulaceae archaeon]